MTVSIDHTMFSLPVALLNTSILTEDGSYEMKTISLELAREIFYYNKIESAIGHSSTAEIMTLLLGASVEVNRQMFSQKPEQAALVFKLNGRPTEGKILSIEEIQEIGYAFKLLLRTK